jgi:hypothetical protein
MNLSRKARVGLGVTVALLGLCVPIAYAAIGLAKATPRAQHSFGFRHFELTRYVGGQKVWFRRAEVRQGWTTIDEKPYLVFIGAGDLSGDEPPDFAKGVRYHYAYFPGYGVISAREIDPAETWVFSADRKTVVDPIGRVFERRYRFDYECTLHGKRIHQGNAEVGAGWVLISINDRVIIVFKSPEALPEEKPVIPQDVAWAHLYLPGVGEFYARVDEPDEVWTLKSADYGATASGKAGTNQP